MCHMNAIECAKIPCLLGYGESYLRGFGLFLHCFHHLIGRKVLMFYVLSSDDEVRRNMSMTEFVLVC